MAFLELLIGCAVGIIFGLAIFGPSLYKVSKQALLILSGLVIVATGLVVAHHYGMPIPTPWDALK